MKVAESPPLETFRLSACRPAPLLQDGRFRVQRSHPGSRGLSGTMQVVLFGLAAVPRKVQCRRLATGGKFYQLDGAAAAKDLVPAAFGPLGVVVAGWTEDELETLVAPLLEDSFAGGDGSAAMVPVRVLDKADMKQTLQEVLESLQEMDSVLPRAGDEAVVARPMVIFSGWPPERMLAAVRQLRNHPQVQRSAMSAMAVPRAMGKQMKQLAISESVSKACADLRGDFGHARSPRYSIGSSASRGER